MGLIDIIIFGIMTNALLGFIMFVTLFVIMLTEAAKDPTKIVSTNKIQNKIDLLGDIRLKMPFLKKYEDHIAFFIPFSGLIRYPMILKSLYVLGMEGYLDLKLKVMEDIINKNEKGDK